MLQRVSHVIQLGDRAGGIQPARWVAHHRHASEAVSSKPPGAFNSGQISKTGPPTNTRLVLNWPV